MREPKAKITRSPFYRPAGSTSVLQRPLQRQSVLNQPMQPAPVYSEGASPIVLNLNYSDPNMAELYRDGFLHSYPEVHSMSAMHREGSVLMPDAKHTIHLSKCLFDSGALHASYISPKLVNKYRKELLPYIKPING